MYRPFCRNLCDVFFHEANSTMANPVPVKIQSVNVYCFVCSSLWSTILVPGYSESQNFRNFPETELLMVFWHKDNIRKLHKNHSVLAKCHPIEFWTSMFPAQLFSSKYKINCRNFIYLKETKSRQRVCSFKFFKNDPPSKTSTNSFVTLSTALANYLVRHSFICGFQKSVITAVKNFRLMKTVSVDVISSYYIVCTCWKLI